MIRVIVKQQELVQNLTPTFLLRCSVKSLEFSAIILISFLFVYANAKVPVRFAPVMSRERGKMAAITRGRNCVILEVRARNGLPRHLVNHQTFIAVN